MAWCGKMAKYHEMLGAADCPYEFSLEVSEGTVYRGRPPYPDLTVLSVDDSHIRELRWQRILVRADNFEMKSEDVQIMRLVAIIEGGGEIEMQRVAVPAELMPEEPSDRAKCVACGDRIPFGAGIEVDGKWYHEGRCYLSD